MCTPWPSVQIACKQIHPDCENHEYLERDNSSNECHSWANSAIVLWSSFSAHESLARWIYSIYMARLDVLLFRIAFITLNHICGECVSTTDQTQNQSSLEESSVKLTNNWKRFKLELKSSRELLFYKLAGGRTVMPASCFHQMSLSCVLGAAGAQNLEQACSGDSHHMHTLGCHGRTEDGGRRQLVGSQRLPPSADHASLSTNISLKPVMLNFLWQPWSPYII